jgi:hypothetical protein
MDLKQDIARREAYIAQASRRIEKQRRLIGRSRNGQTVAAARDLVELLRSLLLNVERQHGQLQRKADTAAAKKSH